MKRIFLLIAAGLCLSVASVGQQATPPETSSNPSTQHASKHHHKRNHAKKHGGKHQHNAHRPAT